MHGILRRNTIERFLIFSYTTENIWFQSVDKENVHHVGFVVVLDVTNFEGDEVALVSLIFHLFSITRPGLHCVSRRLGGMVLQFRFFTNYLHEDACVYLSLRP